jgi:hypothetical protein
MNIGAQVVIRLVGGPANDLVLSVPADKVPPFLGVGQGRRKEAHDILAPVSLWFTEGFDTADLVDATAVLQATARGGNRNECKKGCGAGASLG